MNFRFGGSEDRLLSHVRSKAVLDGSRFLLMTGPCMPWEDRGVRCSVSQRRVLCTSVPFATQNALFRLGKHSIQ
jgi:hypothetical protein